MDTTSTGLTKTTVNLTPRSAEALDEACATTGNGKTDTVNQALTFFDFVVQSTAEGKTVHLHHEETGERRHIHLL